MATPQTPDTGHGVACLQHTFPHVHCELHTKLTELRASIATHSTPGFAIITDASTGVQPMHVYVYIYISITLRNSTVAARFPNLLLS